MQINFGGREITLKLVYYGPALSGKTTNLRSLHQLTTEGARGRLMTLETKDDRTLFFDMLPLTLRAEPAAGVAAQATPGMSLRIKIFTVPGQVLHASTRKLVLQGADGVAFVADSQISETEHNAASFFDLRQNLKDLKLSLKNLPLVIQFNKRDLDKVRSDEELAALARKGREPVFRASAVNGQGVLETFFGLLHLTWAKLDAEHQDREDARNRARGAVADGGPPARRREGRPDHALGVRRRKAGSQRAGDAMSGEAKLEAPDVSVDDLLLDTRIQLEDLVDRDALDEMCKSFVALFGIPVRIYSNEGALLADTGSEQELCAYVNRVPEGRRACASTVGAVRAREAGETGDVLHPCFTGAAYRIIALQYEGRRVGRLIVGPFVPHNVAEPPPTLLEIGGRSGGIEKDRAQVLLARMPRAKLETVTRIAAHLKASLDLILFSGHKSFVTSKMHLMSVRESYRQLEEKNAHLQEAFDKLRELDRLKSNFLATVSHELRTPLTSIIGYSEMLTEGLAGALSSEQMEFVTTIHTKGGQLLSLIMGLLDLSKLESGTMRLKMGPMRIEPVLGEVVSTLTPTARKKGVRLELVRGQGLAELRGDPERLRQVFLNLVENAIKFTPAQGTISLVTDMVEGDADDEEADGLTLVAPTRARLRVRVADTGIGIPGKEKEKVFDAFYQVDSSSTREYGGTGLGLSIVKRLVEGHGGAIAIEDNRPRGTVFVVTLPQSADS